MLLSGAAVKQSERRRRAPAWGLLSLFAWACTGEPVGELVTDAGSGGQGGDAAADADAGAGAGPEWLAVGLDCPSDLRVSGGTLSFVEQGSLQASGKDGRVRTLPASGCPDGGSACALTLADGQGSPAAIEIDSATGDVYWATVLDGTIWKLPANGLVPEVFAGGQGTPRSLAIDDTALYWVNAGAQGAADGEVRRRYLEGGTVGGIAIATGLESPVAMARIDSNLFFSVSGGTATTGSVETCDITGSGGHVLAQNQSRPRGVAANATHVYWANSEDGSLWRVARSGTPAELLVSGRATPADVAVDADSLYWVEAGTPSEYSDGALVRSDLEGHDATVLAKGLRDPRRLALDSEYVYFVSRGTQGVKVCTQHDGSVARVPKK